MILIFVIINFLVWSPPCYCNRFSTNRGWCIKFTTGINTKIDRVQRKSIKVIKLSFCQNDSPMGGSFWQKDSLITLILFELCMSILVFIPVANLMHHTLGISSVTNKQTFNNFEDVNPTILLTL